MADPKTALTTRYLTALNEELGWQGAPTNDGDVRFEARGLSFWLDNCAPEDPEYLRLRMGFALRSQLGDAGTFDLNSDSDRVVLERLAARLTRSTKGAQLTIDGDFLGISVEQLAAGPNRLPKVDDIVDRLPRMVSMAVAGARGFAEGLQLAGIEAATQAAERID